MMTRAMHVGPYQLRKVLAAEAHCTWYCAADPASGAMVELRVFSPHHDQWKHTRKRLQMARLIQSGAARAVQAHDLLSVDRPYIALDWPSGESLFELQAAASGLSPARLFEMTRQLASAVAEAHQIGLVHGGLDPLSIRLRRDADWSADFTGSERPQAPGVTCDRSVWRAPEAAGEGIQPASDAFGLAATLYWVLFNRPYSDEPTHKAAVLGDQLIAAWPELAGIGCEVGSLLTACMTAEPAQRPAARVIGGELAGWVQRLSEKSQTLEGRFDQTQVSLGSEQLAEPHTDKTIVQEIEPIAGPVPAGFSERIGRFRILEKLGQGGMGAVYRGEDITDGSIVAIKVLSAGLEDDAKSRSRFAKEARMLQSVSSPFIANLLEFNEDNGTNYLVTEYVPGRSLGTVLQDRGRLSEPAALAIVVDVAHGLASAHQSGIVHRDIKPDNILLTEDGLHFLKEEPSGERSPAGTPLVKLSDFGLARSEDQSESLAITQQGAIMGTPWYMSPEQCQGKAVYAPADVYSLGATLFHLLGGRPPFEANTHVGVIQKHCHEPPPSIQVLNPQITDGVQRVLEKALAKNAEARYANADAFLVDLERLLRGQPTSLAVHPKLPQHDVQRRLEFEFSWDLASSPAQLWPFVSNTDRLNQAMGLPPAKFVAQVDPQRGVRRFAETRIAGQRIAWEEHPFEWIEGRRMSVLREFSHGPFRWFVNVVELLPQGNGTRLRHRVLIEPRNLLGRMLGKLEAGIKARRSLTRIYQQMDGYVAGQKRGDPTADAFRQAAPLLGQRARLLRSRLDRLSASGTRPPLVDALGRYLEYAADQEVARIRPKAFAERFGLDASEVVDACLRGVQQGLLVLLWDVLCPSCKIPSDIKDTLAALADHGHCEVCNVDFELDFGRSIEMIFRVHPEIRDVEVRTYCIGGPAFSAHVVAQLLLAAGERFEAEVALADGSYQVRGPQLPFSVNFIVAPTGSTTRWELPLGQAPRGEMVPKLRSGSQVLILHNDGFQDLQLRVERTAARHDAVTAADASANSLFRQLFPGEVLSAGQVASLTTVTLMLVEIAGAETIYAELGDGEAFELVRDALGQMESTVLEHGGALVKMVGEGILATFSDAASAVAVGLNMKHAAGMSGPSQPRQRPLQVAIHRGPAMVTTVNRQLDYFGATVRTLHHLLGMAEGGQLMLTDAIVEAPGIYELVRQAGGDLEVVESELRNCVVHRCRLPA